jgi:hypothetical protein
MKKEHCLRGFMAAVVGLMLAWCPSVWGQKVSVESDTVDAGRTGFRVPVTATFQLHNTSSRHISIKEVKADCGCTRADYPSHSIAAGETFNVSLTYDARMLGHFVKQAAVYYSHSKEPLWLTMKGVVLRDWVDYTKVYPYRFGQLLADAAEIEFDNVSKGDVRQMEIHLFNNSENPMEPRLLHLPSYLQAENLPSLLPPGEPGTIKLTLNTNQVHDYGLTQANVYMAQQLGEKVSPDTEMPVSVVLLPDMSEYEGSNSAMAPRLYLSQDSLTLGILADGKMHNKTTITVGNMGKSMLDISSMQLFSRGISVTLDKRQLKPQETAKMKITIDRDKLLTARLRPRVLMITNDPKRPKATIKIKVL